MTIKEKYVARRLEHQLHFVVRVGVDLHLHRVHVLVIAVFRNVCISICYCLIVYVLYIQIFLIFSSAGLVKFFFKFYFFSSTRQLTAFQTSWDGVHSCVQQCTALTSSYGGREIHCRLSWGSTTHVYCRFSCMGQSAGRLPRKTHAGSMPSINDVTVCFSASSGITSSPTMKFDARPTNFYSQKLSRHGI